MQTEYDYIVIGSGAGGSVVASRLAEMKKLGPKSILVLEAGPDNTNSQLIFDPQVYNFLLTPFVPVVASNPSAFGQLLSRSVCHIDLFNEVTYPNPTNPVDGKTQVPLYHSYARGNGGGGSTSHHGMVDGRGFLGIYDKIADTVADKSWNSCNALFYFKKMETFNYPLSNDDFHGKDGWLQITQSPLFEVTNDLMISAFSKLNVPIRYDSQGSPFELAGIYPTNMQVAPPGFDSNFPEGRRSNAFIDLLLPHINAPNSKIDMKFNSLVTKIEFEGVNNRATTVRVIESAPDAVVRPYAEDTTGGSQDPRVGCATGPGVFTDRVYTAKQEIILCGGAIQTPQVLMLSGIGPKLHLDEAGIDVLVDAPGVGSNVLDHWEPKLFYGMNLDENGNPLTNAKYLSTNVARSVLIVADTVFYDPAQPSLAATTGAGRYSNGGFVPDADYDRYVAFATDNLRPKPTSVVQNSSSERVLSSGLIWEWYSSAEEVATGEPDIHVDILPTAFWTWGFSFDAVTGQPCPNVKPVPVPDGNSPFNPTDIYGQLALLSLTPKNLPFNQNGFANPIFPGTGLSHDPVQYFSFNMENLKIGNLEGTVRLDLNDPTNPRIPPILKERLWKDTDAAERLRKFAEEQVRPLAEDVLLTDKYCGKELWSEGLTGDDLINYFATWQEYGHHISGTAQMGTCDNPMAVCDSKCRVRGVTNLRICDTSVYPSPFLHGYNTTRAGYLVGEVVADFIKKDCGIYVKRRFKNCKCKSKTCKC